MPVPQLNFAGIQTRIPGVYIRNRFPVQAGRGQTPTNVVYILGESQGGIPFPTTDPDITDDDRPMFFSTSGEAQETLVSGNGLYATSFYLTPTTDLNLNIPSGVFYLRVNDGTRATRTLQESANDVIDLKSNLWNAQGNQTSVKVEAASTAGKKVTVKYRGVTIVERDNVAITGLNIQYTGAGSAATMTINGTTLSTTVTGGPGGEDLNLSFAEFKTVGELVQYIDGLGAYSATLQTVSTRPSADLDAATAVDIDTAEYSATANVQALIELFNTETQGLITADLADGATRTLPDNDTSFVFLTGGSSSAATTQNWNDALEFLESRDANCVLVATSDSAIQQMVKDHCVRMSSIQEAKYRQTAVGAATVDTKSQKIAAARLLNSSLCEYWVTPIKQNDPLNNLQLTTFGPWLAAIQAQGIRYANNVTMTLTEKSMYVLGVDETYTRQDEEEYIAAGCSYIKQKRNQFIVGHNVTTYQGPQLILNLPSTVRTTLVMTASVKDRLEQRIANMLEAPDEFKIKELKNWIVTSLLPSYRDESPRFLTADPNTGDPAFSNVDFQIEGDKFFLKYTARIVVPLHQGGIEQEFIVPGQVSNSNG